MIIVILECRCRPTQANAKEPQLSHSIGNTGHMKFQLWQCIGKVYTCWNIRAVSSQLSARNLARIKMLRVGTDTLNVRNSCRSLFLYALARGSVQRTF